MACHGMAWHLLLIQRRQAVTSSPRACHRRTPQIKGAIQVASCNVMCSGARNCFCNAWMVCFVILSIHNFHNTHLVALRVLIGSWANLELSLSAPEMLGLSCRLLIFLMGRRTSSMVMVFSLKSNTAPISCKVCLPMIRPYNVDGPPLEYSTMSGCKYTFLLAEYLTKESSTSPTFLVLKVLLEVFHDFGTALFTTGT